MGLCIDTAGEVNHGVRNLNVLDLKCTRSRGEPIDFHGPLQNLLLWAWISTSRPCSEIIQGVVAYVVQVGPRVMMWVCRHRKRVSLLQDPCF